MMWSLPQVGPLLLLEVFSLIVVTNRSLELVEEFGMNVYPFEDSVYLKEGIVFKYYSGEGEGHPVGPEELEDLVEWLKQTVFS
jgi:hypothetical protein